VEGSCECSSELYGVPKMPRTSLLAEDLLAPQGLCCIELVAKTNYFISGVGKRFSVQMYIDTPDFSLAEKYFKPCTCMECIQSRGSPGLLKRDVA
jgi:hypothetical protein